MVKQLEQKKHMDTEYRCRQCYTIEPTAVCNKCGALYMEELTERRKEELSSFKHFGVLFVLLGIVMAILIVSESSFGVFTAVSPILSVCIGLVSMNAPYWRRNPSTSVIALVIAGLMPLILAVIKGRIESISFVLPVILIAAAYSVYRRSNEPPNMKKLDRVEYTPNGWFYITSIILYALVYCAAGAIVVAAISRLEINHLVTYFMVFIALIIASYLSWRVIRWKLFDLIKTIFDTINEISRKN